MVPGAQVRIIHVTTNREYPTAAGNDGRYLSLPLPIGEYRVEVEAEGFKRSSRSGIILEIQETAVVDVTLEVGPLSEAVDVVADAPLLVTSEATQGQVIDNQKIVDLPLNGRDYIQLATTGGTQFPERGRSADHVTLVTVDDDGVDIANLLMEGILDKQGHVPLSGDTICFEAAVCGQ